MLTRVPLAPSTEPRTECLCKYLLGQVTGMSIWFPGALRTCLPSDPISPGWDGEVLPSQNHLHQGSLQTEAPSWSTGAGPSTLTGGTSAARHTDSPSLHHFRSENPPGKPKGRIIAPGPTSPSQTPVRGRRLLGTSSACPQGWGCEERREPEARLAF